MLDQAKADKYSLFAGPIFDPDDDFFAGVDDFGPVQIQIPRSYWKLVVDKNESGKLEAFAFVLEQDLSAVAFDEEEFAVNEQWAEHMLPILDLEARLAGFEFPKVVRDADMAGQEIAHEIARAAGVAPPRRPPSRSASSSAATAH